MKNIVLVIIAIIAISSFITGCEKNDYQNPYHRTNKQIQ